eukprot:4219326-Pleurochrysis_carterae.AAC.1
MLSILLNVAALGAIVAIGSKQLWNYGTTQRGDPFSSAPLASLPPLFLTTMLLLFASARPRAPTLRLQASDHRHLPARPRRHFASALRTLVALGLALDGNATGAHAPSSFQHSMQPPPALHTHRALSREPERHTTSFALAADSLEAAVCIAVINGHLLSAMWALAKANLLWILHAGRLHMPGRIDPVPMFATYRTDAVLLQPRCRMPRACDPAVPAEQPTSNGVSAANAPRSEASCAHPKHAVEPSLIASSNSKPIKQTSTRMACTDLHITSNPRALI